MWNAHILSSSLIKTLDSNLSGSMMALSCSSFPNLTKNCSLRNPTSFSTNRSSVIFISKQVRDELNTSSVVSALKSSESEVKERQYYNTELTVTITCSIRYYSEWNCEVDADIVAFIVREVCTHCNVPIGFFSSD